MTAWSILTGNSTAPAGSTAWVHLNNQNTGTGGGGGGVIQHDYGCCEFIAEIEEPIYAMMLPEYEAVLDNEIYTVILIEEEI